MFEVTRCPSTFVTGDVTRAMYAARQAELGLWPIGGGWLDQTQKCLDVVEFIRGEEADWKNRSKD